MAETAKLINPNKKVLLPDMKAGCSLASSITGKDVRMLKEKYPNIPMHAKAALFFEEDVMDKDSYDSILDKWTKFLTDKNVLLNDSWFAHDEKDVLAFHEFRHQIPILVNEKNAKDKRQKIGTDMAVSDKFFDEMMRYYEKTLSDTGLPYVIFGHIGDNHLHINLLPGPSQKNLALALYDDIAKKIFSWNGTVSAEHGIGTVSYTHLTLPTTPYV